MKYMLDILSVRYLTLGVDNTKYQCNLMLSILAVCVVTSLK